MHVLGPEQLPPPRSSGPPRSTSSSRFWSSPSARLMCRESWHRDRGDQLVSPADQRLVRILNDLADLADLADLDGLGPGLHDLRRCLRRPLGRRRRSGGGRRGRHSGAAGVEGAGSGAIAGTSLPVPALMRAKSSSTDGASPTGAASRLSSSERTPGGAPAGSLRWSGRAWSGHPPADPRPPCRASARPPMVRPPRCGRQTAPRPPVHRSGRR